MHKPFPRLPSLMSSINGSLSTNPIIMDILSSFSKLYTKTKKIFSGKIAIFTLIFTVLLSSFSFGAVVQAFTDVPQNAYYKPALDWAVQNGVVQDGRLYRPGEILTRQDLAKMLALNFKYPLTSTKNPLYKDIDSKSSYYSYVAAVTNAGIMTGYTANGQLTGFFGPRDGTTRAAVAKVLARGFGLEDSECKTRFPDVRYTEWYGPYIDTMCAYGIMRGDGQGNARPADLINRAEFITMLSRAASLKPVDNTSPVNVEPEPTPEPVVIPQTGGTLKVALASTTPSATSIPSDAASVTYTRFAFSALNDDVAVSSMDIFRSGLGSRDNFDSVWLSVNGFNIGSERSINSDGYANMNLTRSPIIIPKNQTVIVDVKATMSSNVGANLENRLGLKSVSGISTNATRVEGTFPLYGNSMNTSSFQAGSVDFLRDGNQSKINVGSVQTVIGEFRVDNNSTTQDVKLSKLELEINGSGSHKNLANVRIYHAGEIVSDKVTPTKDALQFTFLNSGYVVRQGNTARFSVKADIVSGRDADTIQLKLDNANDLLVRSPSSDSYAIKVNRTNPLTGLLSVHTIDAGSITFARHNSSPAATNVSKDTAKATFLVTQLTIGDNVELRNMRVYLDAILTTGSNGVTPITSAECFSTTSLTSILNAKLQNVKIWNGTKLAAGGQNTLASVSAGSFAAGSCTVSDAYYSFNDRFIVNQGVNLLTLTADVRRFTANNEQFSLSLDNSPSSWVSGKYINSGKDVATTNVNGSASGSLFTITDAGVVLSRQDGFSDGENIVRGSQDIVLLKFKVENNNVSDVRITDLTVQDSDGVLNSALNDVNGALLTGFGIYESGTNNLLTRSLQDLGPDDTARFDSLNITIPSGGFKTFDIRGSISGAWNSSDDIQLYITQVGAKDSRNNTATVSYPNCIGICVTNDTLSFANFDINDTANVVVSFASRNDNKYSRLQSPTGSCQIASCAKQLAQIKFRPLYDNVQIKKLVLTNDDGAQNFSQRFGTFFLVDELSGDVLDTGTLSDAGGASNGRVVFEGFNYVLKKEVDNRLNVLGEIHNIVRSENTGSFVKLYLGGVSSSDLRLLSVGTSSDITTSNITNEAVSSSPQLQTHIIRRTVPYVAYLNTSISKKITGSVNAVSVYKFSVKADQKGDIEWDHVTFNISETAGLSSSNYKLFVDGQAQALTTASSVSGGRVILTPTSRQNIPAGGMTTYVLKTDILVSDTAASQTLAVELTAEDDTTLVTNSLSNLSSANFVWSDKSAQSHSTASLDWTNGFQVDSFDVNTVNVGYQGTG